MNTIHSKDILKIAKKERKITKPLVIVIISCLLCIALFGVKLFGSAEPTKSPKEAIEILTECGIIDPAAMGAMVGTVSSSGRGMQYKANPIKSISEDVLRHYSMYERGVEKLDAYPYIDKLLELYRRANTKQNELQAQGLAKDYEMLDRIEDVFAGNNVESTPQILKRLPVQCLKAFTAKGVKIANFEDCRQSIDQVGFLDTSLIDFIYTELCGGSSHLLNIADKDGWTPLMTASRFYTADIVSKLIKAGAKVETKNQNGWTPLMLAARYNSEDVCNSLISGGADVNNMNNGGISPLMLATCNIRNSDVVNHLIDRGAEIEAKDNSGWTPLIWAGRYGTAEICQRLFEKGANLEEKDKNGWTSLLYAARYNSVEVCNKLIELGTDINAKNHAGFTPLMLAPLNFENKNVTNALIEAGADLNAQDNEGRTMLMRVYTDPYKEYGKYGSIMDKMRDKTLQLARENKLNELSANVNEYTDQEAENLASDLIGMLLKAGADVNVRDNTGHSIYTLALKNNSRSKLVQELQQAGGVLNLKNEVDREVFAEDICWDVSGDPIQNAFIYSLIKDGANINDAKIKNGCTPLLWAVEHKTSEVCQQLIELGADVNAKDEYGHTALMLAPLNVELIKAYQNNSSDKDQANIVGFKIIDALIQGGADINAQDNEGHTLLQIALSRGRLYNKNKLVANSYSASHNTNAFRWEDLVDKLLEVNANLNIKDKDGVSPFSQCLHEFANCKRGTEIDNTDYYKWAEKMLKSGGDIEEPDENYRTRLMRACKEYPDTLLIPTLIRLGANIDAKDNEGWTPLMYAAYYSDEKLTSSIIEAGADVNSRNIKGETALMIAIMSQNHDREPIPTQIYTKQGMIIYQKDRVIASLVNAGADINAKSNEGKTAKMYAEQTGYTDGIRTLEEFSKSGNIPASVHTQKNSRPTTNTPSFENGTSKAKSELSTFIRAITTMNTSDSTIQLYQKRLSTLLPMIRDGADVNVSPTEMKGNTALHYACGMGNLELVQWLVEHGADVNKRTNKGASPLNCVGGANGAQIRSFLIQHGAVK